MATHKLDLNKNISDVLNIQRPSKSRIALGSEGQLKSHVSLLKLLGSSRLKVWDPSLINVWTRKLYSEKHQLQPTKMTSEAGSQVPVSEIKQNSMNHLNNILQSFASDFYDDGGWWVVLDEKSYSHKDIERVVVGYGDAYNNGNYGAGPTRNPLRAFYSPFVLAVFNFVVLKTRSFGLTFNGSIINELESKLMDYGFTKDSGKYYSYSVYEEKIHRVATLSTKIGGELYFLELMLTNTSKERQNAFTYTFNGDLGIVLSNRQFISGHRFLRPKDRQGSPGFGDPWISMGAQDVQELYQTVKAWSSNAFSQLMHIISNILPKSATGTITKAIAVENS
ncbi:MAG: hypothetical protein N3G80_04645 [Candidatus Micrarchaeota archaeon]|nr:hypothetical protein [Candidatus Micrarchaeota archaeon]